jgi:ATP-dependent Clp protease ATP-binding subunit ClpB
MILPSRRWPRISVGRVLLLLVQLYLSGSIVWSLLYYHSSYGLAARVANGVVLLLIVWGAPWALMRLAALIGRKVGEMRARPSTPAKAQTASRATPARRPTRVAPPWWRRQPLNSKARERLAQMEPHLRARIVGQDAAIAAVVAAVRRAATGLHDPQRPVASFLFAGPTGTGKTDLVKGLTVYLYGDEGAMVRIDMSEYQEKHNVARLIGAPPGYIGHDQGGQFTDALRRSPHTVVLFDEIEKAAPEVFDILLQVLDDGRLTDGQGRTVDCTNAIIVMTSNAGAREIQRHVGDPAAMQAAMEEALRTAFRPEFLNRLDATIVFEPLSPTSLEHIVTRQFQVATERIARQGIAVRVTPRALTALARDGYDPANGARPLKRVIQARVVDPLAGSLLAGEYRKGDTVGVDHDGDGYHLSRLEKQRR